MFKYSSILHLYNSKCSFVLRVSSTFDCLMAESSTILKTIYNKQLQKQNKQKIFLPVCVCVAAGAGGGWASTLRGICLQM